MGTLTLYSKTEWVAQITTGRFDDMKPLSRKTFSAPSESDR